MDVNAAEQTDTAVVASDAATPADGGSRGGHEDVAASPSDRQEAGVETTSMPDAAAPQTVGETAVTLPVECEGSCAAAGVDTTTNETEANDGGESEGLVPRDSEQTEDIASRAAADQPEVGEARAQSGLVKTAPQHEEQSPEVSGSASIVESASEDGASTTATEANAVTSNPEASAIVNVEAHPAPRRTFLSSLTAQFASETKRAWADVFGVRYESEEEAASSADHSSEATATSRPTSRSLTHSGGEPRRADTGADKPRDDRVQASRQHYRDRIRQLTRTASQPSPSATRPAKAAASAWTHGDGGGTSPLERAGLSLTQIRFCQERALDETCRAFQQMHARLVSEGAPEQERKRSDQQQDVQHGVFLTQWELEQALLASQGSGGGSEEQSAIDPAYAEIPIETLLQASWFLPFDQLPRLRTLVLQITRRHLNEHRLARLNRFLKKQLLWIPHSSKLQQLVVGLTGGEHGGITTDGRGIRRLQSDPALIREFVECIDARPRVSEPTDGDYCAFLSLQPLKLASKWQLGNILALQRLVFFRLLVVAIAQERRRLDDGHQSPDTHRSKRDTLASAARRKTLMDALHRHPVADAVKSRKRKVKLKRRRSSVVDDESEEHERQQSSSEQEEEEDPAMDSTDEGGHSKTAAPEKETTQDVPIVAALNKRLADAIEKLASAQRSVQPPLPAVQATHVAATAFHQRVARMIQDGVGIDADTSQQLQQLIKALDATLLDFEGASKARTGSPRRATSTFPPPYPESVEENQSNSDDSDIKRVFPPPYVKTTPAFWSFEPAIDPPKPSIAKLHAAQQGARVPPHVAVFPSSYTARDAASKSPGVGSYDIRRSDRLTFPERQGHSFAPASSEPPSSASIAKGRVWKSSLAYPPPLPQPPVGDDSNDEDDWVGSGPFDMAKSALEESTTRVEAETQCGSPPSPSKVPGAFNSSLSEALRLQQRMFVDDFVQTVAARQPKPAGPATTAAKRSVYHRPSPSNAVHWKSSDTSRFVSRLRQRRSSASALLSPTREDAPPSFSTPVGDLSAPPTPPAPRPTKSRTGTRPASCRRSTAVAVSVALPSPDGRVEPSAEHLAWATCVGAMYTERVTSASQ